MRPWEKPKKIRKELLCGSRLSIHTAELDQKEVHTNYRVTRTPSVLWLGHTYI